MVICNFDYTKIYMLDSEFLESMKTKNIAFFQFAATLIDLIDYSTDEQPPQFLSKKLRPYQTIPYVVINQSRSAENLCRIVKPSLEKTNQLFVYLYDMITLLEDSLPMWQAHCDSRPHMWASAGPGPSSSSQHKLCGVSILLSPLM